MCGLGVTGAPASFTDNSHIRGRHEIHLPTEHPKSNLVVKRRVSFRNKEQNKEGLMSNLRTNSQELRKSGGETDKVALESQVLAP